MSATHPQLLLTSSPFLKKTEDTPYVMRQVIYSLLPTLLAAIYFFGISAFVITGCCVLSAIVTEWLLNGRQSDSLKDASAILTGLLLALTLPPATPVWMAVVGGVVAIALGKWVFGGLGANIFNPALVGRAFLQAAFPVAITTWYSALLPDRFAAFIGNTLGLPFQKTQIVATTSATPLASMKFEQTSTAFEALFWGSTAGSLGETSGIIILLGGGYLVLRRMLNWRIPTGILLTVLVLSYLLHWMDNTHFASGEFHLFSGGLMLGAIYMATDPVTSPITQRGCWVFAVGVGGLVVLIRNFGGLPEGVMYAILLMNAVTPIINRLVPARVFGEKFSLGNLLKPTSGMGGG